MKKKFWLTFIVVMAVWSSCGDTEELYSRYPCRLFFDNSIHNDATLAGAMTPGTLVFTTITLSGKQFMFIDNQGHSSVINMTAIEERRQPLLGLNNGIIVGYGRFDPITFYAYDRECPNCFDVKALPVRSYKLTVNPFGIATCATCHREYDLTNGGIISKGDAGKKLTRYHAITTGPYGKLSI